MIAEIRCPDCRGAKYHLDRSPCDTCRAEGFVAGECLGIIRDSGEIRTAEELEDIIQTWESHG